MDAVEFSSHPHPLNLIEYFPNEDGAEAETEAEAENEAEESRVCGLCGEMIKGPRYECSKCNFTAHPGCAANPPSLVKDMSKIHEHTLTLLPRHVSFTCNACGLPGDKSPYVCLKCCIMIHKECIEFPRAIRITRHEHRLSHTWFLGPGKWSCKICYKNIDGKYGAYSCGFCENYALHLRCATNEHVWDGRELEGVPEEEDEIKDKEMLFVPSGDGDDKLIHHVSHEHGLTLEDDLVQPERVGCFGCASPIGSDPFYRCDDDKLCDFVLHKTCANLPRTRNTVLHQHTLTLCTDDRHNMSPCEACHLPFSGFRYRCLQCEYEFDVRCSSVRELNKYELHTHILYFGAEDSKVCSVCNHTEGEYLLTCDACDFRVCFACSHLPGEVNYKYDEHFLSHTFGEDVTGLYWCDLCEVKIHGKSNHYKCSDCGSVIHIDCAVGSFRNIRPGPYRDPYHVVLNDRTSLLRCSQCHNDCHEPLLLKSSITSTTDVTVYLCSFPCFKTYVSL